MGVNNNYPTPAQNPRLDVAYLRSLMSSLLSAMNGKLNCAGEFTLDTSAASTTVKNRLCNEKSVITLMPLTAHASADIGAGTIYITPASGEFTITHANNANTDRTFRYVLIG